MKKYGHGLKKQYFDNAENDEQYFQGRYRQKFNGIHGRHNII